MTWRKEKTFIYSPHVVDDMCINRVYDISETEKKLGFNPKYKMRNGIINVVNQLIEKKMIKVYMISPLFVILLILFVLYNIITFIF